MSIRMLVGGLAYFLLAQFGMALFSLQPSNITLLWLPSGVGLLMCLSAGSRALPLVFLASFLANFHGMALPSIGWQVLHTLIAATADSFAAWFAAFMLRRHLPLGLSRPHDLIPFTLFVCVVPMLASALILAGNLVLGGYIAWTNAVDFIFMLLVADSLGILICYPMLEEWNKRHQVTRAEILSWLKQTAGVMLIVHGAFVWSPALIFLLIPAFLYMIFWKHHAGEHLTLVLGVCLIVAEAARNLGPFQVGKPEDGRLMLVFFLFSIALTVTGMRLQQKLLLAKQALVEDQNTQLYQAKETAEAANIAKSNFMANMSHEMRTPLHQLTGLAKLIRREPLTAKQADHMDRLDVATKRLVGIIETVLDLNHMESMTYRPVEEAFTVADIFGDVVREVGKQAQAKQLKLEIENAVADPVLLGDRGQILRSLLNYAVNAITFTNVGSIILRGRVDASDGDAWLLRFEVEDSGIGIAAEDIPRLFSIFEQGDNSSTRKYGGLGLGLAVTRKIARMLGGDAGCESTPCQGSRFWFTVRVRQGEALQA